MPIRFVPQEIFRDDRYWDDLVTKFECKNEEDQVLYLQELRNKDELTDIESFILKYHQHLQSFPTIVFGGKNER